MGYVLLVALIFGQSSLKMWLCLEVGEEEEIRASSVEICRLLELGPPFNASSD